MYAHAGFPRTITAVARHARKRARKSSRVPTTFSEIVLTLRKIFSGFILLLILLLLLLLDRFLPHFLLLLLLLLHLLPRTLAKRYSLRTLSLSVASTRRPGCSLK